MKKFLSSALITLLVSIISAGLFVFFTKETQGGILHSPLPDFLTLNKNKQVTLLDIWLPFIQQAQGSEFDSAALTAKSVLMYDLTTEKSVFEKNPRKRLPMASLTKIMAAIVSLENPRSDDRYVVSKDNIVGEDSMGLSPGEVMTLHELLYGLMLPSGNDAAEV